MEENLDTSTSMDGNPGYLSASSSLGGAPDRPTSSWSKYSKLVCERVREDRSTCESKGSDYESERCKAEWSKTSEESEASSQLDLENREVFARLMKQWQWQGTKENNDYSRRTRYHDAAVFCDLGDRLQIGPQIGEGGQAIIYEGYLHSSEPNQQSTTVVLKVFKKSFKLADLERLWPEPFLVAKSRTGGVISKDGVKVDDQDSVKYKAFTSGCIDIWYGTLLKDGRFAFVMKNYWGDLRKLIDIQTCDDNYQIPPFVDPMAIAIIYQIAKGMKALHALNILHRDLKASNVLLMETPLQTHGTYYRVRQHDAMCYVGDFESSARCLGTEEWNAPEVLLATKERAQIYEAEIWTQQSDVYNFAMTCYEVLTGVPLTVVKLDVIAGERPPLPPYVHRDLQALLEKCWRKDPLERPNFGEIVLKIEEFRKLRFNYKQLSYEQRRRNGLFFDRARRVGKLPSYGEASSTGSEEDDLAAMCSQEATFKLFDLDDELPPEYRLATVQDVKDSPMALSEAMPGSEIANLADGSVDGKSCGSNTRVEKRNDARHQLALRMLPRLALKGYSRGEDPLIPSHYRFATIQDVIDSSEELRNIRFTDLLRLVMVQPDGILVLFMVFDNDRDPVPMNPPRMIRMEFKPYGIREPIFPGYRFATVKDVDENPGALNEARQAASDTALPMYMMMESVRGFDVVLRCTSLPIRQKIPAVLQDAISSDRSIGGLCSPEAIFKLFGLDDELPPLYRLATVQDVKDNPMALSEAMPGSEVANLADGSVDGKSCGSQIRMEMRKDARHQLALRMLSRLVIKSYGVGQDPLIPPQYRFATIQDVIDCSEELSYFRLVDLLKLVMVQSDDILMLYILERDESDEGDEGDETLQQLPMNLPLMTFKSCGNLEKCPPQYRFATVKDVDKNPAALNEARQAASDLASPIFIIQVFTGNINVVLRCTSLLIGQQTIPVALQDACDRIMD